MNDEPVPGDLNVTESKPEIRVTPEFLKSVHDSLESIGALKIVPEEGVIENIVWVNAPIECVIEQLGRDGILQIPDSVES